MNESEKITENERKREKMENMKKSRSIVAFTGTAAVLAIAVNLVIAAIKHLKDKIAKKKDLVGSKIRVNLSASEIVKLANQIIAKSNEVHNSVASVPLDKDVIPRGFNSIQFRISAEFRCHTSFEEIEFYT